VTPPAFDEKNSGKLSLNTKPRSKWVFYNTNSKVKWYPIFGKPWFSPKGCCTLKFL